MDKATTQILGATAVLGLLLSASAIVVLPLARDDQLAFALVLLTPVFLTAIYIVMQGVTGNRIFGALTAVAYIFIASAVFRVRNYDDKSIDLQVAAKLAAFGMIMVTDFCFIIFAMARLALPRLFFVWLLFFLALVGCSLYAVKPVFALTCSVLFLSCYLYTVYMTTWLSRVTAVEVMMCAALALCVGSIFVYYAIPSIGVMEAWTPEAGFGEIGRMKGLTGSANGIGFIAAFALVLAILYYRSCSPFGKAAVLLLVPSALVCLVLSNNRSSMVAVVAALWFRFVLQRNTGFRLVLTVAFTLVGAAALTFFSDEIFAALSRSGHASEITSATGRSAIWAVVIEMWAKQPLHGYGYTSALAILPLDPRLFQVAAHAHNMYLELLFAGGLILLGLFLYAIWRTLRLMYRLGAVNEAALLMFFMLRGLTEATPFSGMVGYSGLAFALTISLVIAQLTAMRAPSGAKPVRAWAATRGPAPVLQRSPS